MKSLVTEGILDENKLRDLALFINIALQTDGTRIVERFHQQDGKTFTQFKDEFVGRINTAFAEYLPPPEKREAQQRTMLARANMEFSANAPLAKAIIAGEEIAPIVTNAPRSRIQTQINKTQTRPIRMRRVTDESSPSESDINAAAKAAAVLVGTHSDVRTTEKTSSTAVLTQAMHPGQSVPSIHSDSNKAKEKLTHKQSRERRDARREQKARDIFSTPAAESPTGKPTPPKLKR